MYLFEFQLSSLFLITNLHCSVLCIITLRASEAAAQCIVIAPVCLYDCLWVCYHDNSKLRASILTKLGLQVKLVTISS